MTGDKKDLSGKVFVIYGELQIFPSADELEKLIVSMDGRVIRGINNSVSYLINNDKESNCFKNEKARRLGIPIITEGEFASMIM